MADGGERPSGGVDLEKTIAALKAELRGVCPPPRLTVDFPYGTAAHGDREEEPHWKTVPRCQACGVMRGLERIDKFVENEQEMIEAAVTIAAMKKAFLVAERAAQDGCFFTARLGETVGVPREELERYLFMFEGNAIAQHILAGKAGRRPNTLLNDLVRILGQAGYSPAAIAKLVIDDHGDKARRERMAQRQRRDRRKTSGSVQSPEASSPTATQLR
jgi:hypothetical protein